MITLRVLLLIAAFGLFASPAISQTVIEPCPATPATPATSATPAIKPGAKPAIPAIIAAPAKTDARVTQTNIDASIPDDPAVEKMLGPYSEKVRALSVIIGRLDASLKKDAVGAGSLGNFVTDAVRAQAEARLGKPVTLVMMNSGGLRKNEISPGELRASDIFELLPFENALVALEVNGAQLQKLLEITPRDAQSGARVQFKWNDQNRPEFLSGKLIDEKGQEQEIDPQKIYTVVTIDYLVRLGSGAYALLHEAKSNTPLNVTLRDAVMNYVKAETAAGREVRSRTDNRYVQVGPDRKRVEDPR